MNNEKFVENVCFGQILGTLYYHLEESLKFGNKMEILSISVDESKRTGTAIVSERDNIRKYIFDGELDIWIQCEKRVRITSGIFKGSNGTVHKEIFQSEGVGNRKNVTLYDVKLDDKNSVYGFYSDEFEILQS